MASYRHRTLVTAALAVLMILAALASGCQSAPKASGSPVVAAAENAPAAGSHAADGSSADEIQLLDAAKASPLANDTDPGSNGITVSGQGSVTLKPDVAYIEFGVESQDADLGKSRKANNAAMDKALAAVKAFGVTDDDITTTRFDIYPTYDDKGQKITGYRINNVVRVRVKSLDKLGAILTAVTDAGANTSYGISFDVMDRTAAYNDALKQAMAKARARAEIMAGALGVKVGKVLAINETGGYSGPVYSGMREAAADKAAAVPVQTGMIEVPASVSVVYEIVK